MDTAQRVENAKRLSELGGMFMTVSLAQALDFGDACYREWLEKTADEILGLTPSVVPEDVCGRAHKIVEGDPEVIAEAI